MAGDLMVAPCICRSARKTLEQMVNEEGQVPVSRHYNLVGQRSCILGKGPLLVPALVLLLQLRKCGMFFSKNVYRRSSPRRDVLLREHLHTGKLKWEFSGVSEIPRNTIRISVFLYVDVLREGADLAFSIRLSSNRAD